VHVSKNGTFLFHRDFMDYHSDRFKDFSLLVFKGKKLIAVLPANRIDNEIYSHSGLSYGGLVVSKSLKFDLFVNCFKHILIYLEEKGITYLHLNILPTIYASQPSQELNFILKSLKAELKQRHILSTIDLREDFNINSNRLEGKKRGEKEGLEIKEENNFKSFWEEILTPNLEIKHGVRPVHSLTEIQTLAEKFPKEIRQFNVYHKNKIVAGTTIFEAKNVAHAQYISGNQDKNQLGSLDYLYYHLIKDVFKDKKFFDFGTSNENAGFNINKGLLFWKEGFGARSYIQDFYKLKVSQHKILDSIFI
jgi:hypothetical protein